MENKMTTKTYIKAHLLVFVLASICFINTLFHPLKGWGMISSLILFYSIFAVSFIGTLFVTMREFREFAALLLPMLLASLSYLCLYFISYGNEKQKLIVIPVLAVVLLLGLWPMFHKDRDVKEKYGGMLLILLGVTILLIATFFMSINAAITKTGEKGSGAVWTMEDTLEWHAEELCTLHNIESLSETERRSLAETFVRIHSNDLGCPNIGLEFEALPEGIYGRYSNADKTITVNINLLQRETDGWALYRMLCHECYICYALSLTQLYRSLPEEYRSLKPFRDVRRFYEKWEKQGEDAMDFFRKNTEENAAMYEIESEERARAIVKDYLAYMINNNGENLAIV